MVNFCREFRRNILTYRKIVEQEFEVNLPEISIKPYELYHLIESPKEPPANLFLSEFGKDLILRRDSEDEEAYAYAGRKTIYYTRPIFTTYITDEEARQALMHEIIHIAIPNYSKQGFAHKKFKQFQEEAFCEWTALHLLNKYFDIEFHPLEIGYPEEVIWLNQKLKKRKIKTPKNALDFLLTTNTPTKKELDQFYQTLEKNYSNELYPRELFY